MYRYSLHNTGLLQTACNRYIAPYLCHYVHHTYRRRTGISQQRTQNPRKCTVFISHAGEQKKDAASTVFSLLKSKGVDASDIFFDQKSIHVGDEGWPQIESALQSAAVVVAILSWEFVRKKSCMKELEVILKRLKIESSGNAFRVVPWFCKPKDNQVFSFDQCLKAGGDGSLRREYGQSNDKSVVWPGVNEQRPDEPTLDKWAGWVRELCTVSAVRSDEKDQYVGDQAESVADAVVAHLTNMGRMKLDQGLRNTLEPPRARRLFGRKEEVAQVLSVLREHRYVDVVGGAGEGKSDVARTVATQLWKEWQKCGGMYEIDMRHSPQAATPDGQVTQDSTEQAVRDIVVSRINAVTPAAATQAGLSRNFLWEDVLTWLRDLRQPVLLVFENAEDGCKPDRSKFNDILRSLHGCNTRSMVHIMVVSRQPIAAIRHAPSVCLLPLQPEAAVAMLQSLIPRLMAKHEMQAAEKLAEAVKCNALLLTVAPMLICEGGMSWEDATTLAHTSFSGLPDAHNRELSGMDRYVKTLGEWLARHLSAEYHEFLANVAMFRGSFCIEGAAAVQGGMGVEETRTKMQHLVRLSLVYVRGGGKYDCHAVDGKSIRFDLHAIVQASTCHKTTLAAPLDSQSAAPVLVGKQPVKPWLRGLLQWLGMLQVSDHKEVPSPWLRLLQWLYVNEDGPGQTLVKHCPGSEAASAAGISMCRPALTLDLTNLIHGAKILERLWDTSFISKHFKDFNSVHSALMTLGEYHAAKELALCVHNITIHARGPTHPHSLKAKKTLAVSYSELGEYQHAMELEEEVLASRLKVLGAEHPDTLRVKGNLALSYSQLGHHQRALGLKEEVLEGSLKVLGAEHPDTLRAKGILAESYSGIGDHQRARQLQEQVLAGRLNVLGAEHPDTLRAKGNLAASYSDLGDHQHALQLEEEVLESKLKVLGAEHPETLRAKINLAESCSRLGDHQRALELKEEVLTGRLKVLGAEHPDTLRTKGNLALSYSRLGEYQRSLGLKEEALAGMLKVLGAEHPETLTAKVNLALSYSRLGNQKRALELEEEVLASRLKALGAEHPHTLLAKRNLAFGYSLLGDHQRALGLMEEVLAGRQAEGVGC